MEFNKKSKFNLLETFKLDWNRVNCEGHFQDESVLN